jgi:hypothetical protein
LWIHDSSGTTTGAAHVAISIVAATVIGLVICFVFTKSAATRERVARDRTR